MQFKEKSFGFFTNPSLIGQLHQSGVCAQTLVTITYLSLFTLIFYYMYDAILSLLTGFALTFLAIPSIINIAVKKHLVDEPGERRSHQHIIPTLGGIGIFAGVIFSIVLWTPFAVFQELQYILCSLIIIFLIGAKDDILPMSAGKKLLGQFIAAGILVVKAKILITSLYGIFNIYELPIWASSALTLFTIIVIINAFNLIDGINGLAGSVCVLIAGTLGTWFLLVDRMEMAVVAFALCGSVIGFLKYNYTPVKIFMGDTGSLLIGTISAVLVIAFIEMNRLIPDSIYNIKSAPAVAFGILILPLYDTLRVFAIRLFRGHSPFKPDRRHIHHMLLDLGLSHMQATGALVTVNAFFIVFSFYFHRLGNLNLIVLNLLLATVLSSLPYFFIHILKKPSKPVGVGHV